MSKVKCKISNFTKDDIPKMAQFLEAVWLTKENAITLDRWTNWLENLDLDFPSFSITATIDNTLVGWILLVQHSPTEVQINPWALGGHPITLAAHDSSFKLSTILLEEAVSLTKKEGFRKIEILYHLDEKTSSVFEKFYQANNFTHLDSTNHMRKSLESVDEKYESISDNFKITKVSNSNHEDLLACFLTVFKNTNDPWMKEKTTGELTNYFHNKLVGGSFTIIDDASVTISKNEKIIGFSIVKQSHGEGNGNIWIIGVHPDFRRKKIGTGIFTYVTKALQNLDYKTMSLNVSSFNVPAYQLYLKVGFEIRWTQMNLVLKP
ncbi:MAG: GNAT family N-acetyltransferase [Candidatus Heimdallarchaeota archaeon]